MERDIRAGDLIVINYGHTSQSYPITEIAAEGIYFRSDDGESLAVPAQGRYVIQGLTVPHEVTFAAIPDPQPVQPIGLTVPQPAQPFVTQAARPAQTFAPQPAQPMIQQPIAPKSPTRRKPPNTPVPEQVLVGQTGRISGLGTMYGDDTDKVRPVGKYRFQVTRVMRNGKNVVIQLEDGSVLTLRWHNHGATVGHGWAVRTMQNNRVEYEVINIDWDYEPTARPIVAQPTQPFVPQPAQQVPRPFVPQPAQQVPRPFVPQPVQQVGLTIPQQPIAPKSPARPRPPRAPAPLPDPVRVGQTGRISGLGAQYNDDTDKIRPWGTYSFLATRVLRNGKNIIIQLADGSVLTLRWHDFGTYGYRWAVRTKQNNRAEFQPVDVFWD